MKPKHKPPHTAWKPGQSGNPSGRPKGIPNPSARLRKLIDVEPIIKKLQDAANGGDVQAARTLLERALPVYRTTAQPVELPELDAAPTLTDKARVILAAVARGDVAPDIGTSLVAAVGSLAKVAEIDELTARIKALEDAKHDKP